MVDAFWQQQQQHVSEHCAGVLKYRARNPCVTSECSMLAKDVLTRQSLRTSFALLMTWCRGAYEDMTILENINGQIRCSRSFMRHQRHKSNRALTSTQLRLSSTTCRMRSTGGCIPVNSWNCSAA